MENPNIPQDYKDQIEGDERARLIEAGIFTEEELQQAEIDTAALMGGEDEQAPSLVAITCARVCQMGAQALRKLPAGQAHAVAARTGRRIENWRSMNGFGAYAFSDEERAKLRKTETRINARAMR